MNHKILFSSTVFSVILLSITLMSTAQAGVEAGSTLNSGFGTPTIDGVINPAEWSGAATLSVFLGAYSGSTLYVMNDGTNLYMALDVTDAVLDVGFPFNDIWDVRFDNGLDLVFTINDDDFEANSENPTDFLVDSHFDGASWGVPDILILPGTADGVSASSLNGGRVNFEVSKPLNSGDAEDFALTTTSTVGVCSRYFDAGISSGFNAESCFFQPDQAQYNNIVLAAPPPTWDGEGVSELWSEAANWSDDTLPAADASQDVLIPSPYTARLDINYPSTGSSAIGTLTVDSGATLVVNSGFVLINDSDLDIAGTLIINAGDGGPDGEVIVEDQMSNTGTLTGEGVVVEGILTIEPFGNYNENEVGFLGELTVQDGGVVNMLGTYLSRSAGETDSVDETSEFNVDGVMTITAEFDNFGTFNINDGGSVEIQLEGLFSNQGIETVNIENGGTLETFPSDGDAAAGRFVNSETVNTDGSIVNNGVFTNNGVVNEECNSVITGTALGGTINDVCVPSTGTIEIIKTTTGGDDAFDFDLHSSPGIVPDFRTFPTIPDTSASTTTGQITVDAGTYSIKEIGIPNGWSLTTADCDSVGALFESVELDNVTNIVVNAGDTVTCTFENEGKGDLTIQKDIPLGGDQTFDFTIAGPEAGSPSITTGVPTFFDDFGEVTISLLGGTYSVSEDALTNGFTFVDSLCVDEAEVQTGTSGTQTVTGVVITPGEETICVFENEDTEDPVFTFVPADIRQESDGILGDDVVAIGLATATDNNDRGAVVTNDAPALFPQGVTIITWTAIDPNGNEVTAEQEITVAEVTIETITTSTVKFDHKEIGATGKVWGWDSTAGETIALVVENAGPEPNLDLEINIIPTGDKNFATWTTTVDTLSIPADFIGASNLLAELRGSVIASSDQDPEPITVEPHQLSFQFVNPVEGGILDQSHLLAPCNQLSFLDDSTAWRQSFTPTVNGLGSIDVSLVDTGSTSLLIDVFIYDTDGNTLLTSELAYPVTGGTVDNIVFTTPASTIAGNTYYIEIFDLTDGDQSIGWCKHKDVGTDLYTGGEASEWVLGSADVEPEFTDHAFATYSVAGAFPDTLFDDDIAFELTLVDDDLETADTGNLGKLGGDKAITATGNGAALTQPSFSANPNLASDIIAAGHGSVGSRQISINSDLSADPQYLSPATGTFDVEILAHTLEFVIKSTTPADLTNSVPFDNEFDMNLRVIDASAQTITNPSTGILDDVARSIEVTGSGVATTGVITSQDVDTLPDPDATASPTDIQTGDVKVQAAGFSQVVTVDQSVIGGSFTTSTGTPIDANSPIGQSFKPLDNELNRVIVGVFDNDPSSPRDIDVTAIIHESTITGTILGTSDPGTITTNGVGGSALSAILDFPTTVALTPGNTYVIELTLSAADPVIIWQSDSSDPYPDGNAVVGGVDAATVDFNFQTLALRDIKINSAGLNALNQYLGPAEISTKIKIDPHSITVDTQPCVPADKDVKWDYTTCLETTVTDNDFINDGDTTPNVISDTGNLGDVAAHEICYSDKGVAGEDVQCFQINPDSAGVSTTVTDPVQVGTADDSGDGVKVISTFDVNDVVDEYGNSPVPNTAIFELNLKPHVLTLPFEPLVNIVEGTGFTSSGILTDPDRVFSDEDFGIGFSLVNFDTGNPSFAQTPEATLTEQEIPFSGDTGGSQTLGTATTGGITFTDTDASFFNTGDELMVLGMTLGGVIEFPPGSAAVGIDIQNLDLFDSVTMVATSQFGNSFEAIAVGVDQNPYPIWDNGVTYEEGDVVEFSGRFYDSKDDGNFGNTPPTTTIPPVLDEDDFWKEIMVNIDFTNFVSTISNGIARIEITDITIALGSTVDVSEIRISDPRGEPPRFLTLNFDELDDLNPAALHLRGPTNTNTFAPGSFHAIAIATAGPSTDNEVGASFTPPGGENAYTQISADPQEYDVIEATWGIGGQAIGIVPDSGAGFTGITCGRDQDSDGLCDGHEVNNAVRINTGFGTTGSIPVERGFLFPSSNNQLQPNPGALQADIYLEIDVMAPIANRLDENAIRDVQIAFKNAPRESPKITGSENCENTPAQCGIFVHAFIDEEVEHIDQLEVWQDFDDIKDDFAAYKAEHFGSPDQRGHLNRVLGSQASSFVNNAFGVLEDIDGDGNDELVDKWDWIVQDIYIETAEDDSFVNTRGRIIVEEQVLFPPGTTVKIDGFKKWNPGAGVAQTVFKNLAGSMKNSIGQDTTTEDAFIFRAESTFDATDTNLVNEDGVNTGKTTVRFWVPAGTDVLGATTKNWRNSPDVVTTWDDGRAQFFRYVLVVDSIGPCGPSGIAEFLGNDMIISLGCGFSNVMTVNDPNPDPNNDNKAPTVGSRAEQANAIMHELGHNLKLNHGGPEEDIITGVDIPGSNINCKPNYDSTMSYTQQSTVWLTGNYNKPHFSSGLMDDIDETGLPDENLGLGTTSTDTPGRKIVFANGQGVVKVDRVTPSGGTVDKIDWNGISGNDDPVPGAVDVNFIPNLIGCEASPGELLEDQNDWDNIQLLFAEGGVAFDGVTACALCLPESTSSTEEAGLATLDWYDGLLIHNQLSPPNYEIFNEIITQEVELGQNMDVSFQLFNCNPNNKFDEVTGEQLPGDLCIDSNMVVKKAGFYVTPLDGKFQNFRETSSGATGEEILVAITDQTFVITIQRVLPLDSPDQTTSVLIPAIGEPNPTFDTVTDGNTIWYHRSVSTENLPTGQYKATITQVLESDSRDLFDYNKKLFNYITGTFDAASFTEIVPGGALTGIDDEGNPVSFLFNIVEEN